MKRFLSALAVFVGVAVSVASTPAYGLRVVTTTPDLAAIVRAVGGTHVTVTSVAEGSQNPHSIEAKPSYIREMSRADLVIYNGLELEIGWLPLLLEGARNPKIRPGSLGVLDASKGISVLEKPVGGVDRSQGDVHPEGNPHYLLDPRNGLVVAGAIAERLSTLDAAHRADYERGLAEFRRDMNARIAGWERRLARLKGVSFVAHHKLWEYLAVWAGFRIVDYIEEKPGIPGSPKHIASVIRRIKTENVRAVLAAVYSPRKECESMAKRTGIPLLILPASVGAEKEIVTYADLFEAIVSQLEKIAEGERG